MYRMGSIDPQGTLLMMKVTDASVLFSTTADKVFVLPAEARMPGASNIEVQSLCPNDQISHQGPDGV